MQKIKYLTFIDKQLGIESGIMFPAMIEHIDMHKQLGEPELIGAGFVDIVEDKKHSKHGAIYIKLQPHGRSTSLNISACLKDTPILMSVYFGTMYRVH